MIEIARQGRLVILRIVRPDRAGALTSAMLRDLAQGVEAVGEDDGVHGLVLTGSGRVFSAGADLDEVRNGDLATNLMWERLSDAVACCPVPVVAALNGTAAGGSLGMVLAADIRISGPHARFFYPVMKMGVLPQPSDPGRLARLIGGARASMMLIGGVEVDAAKAEAWGLIDRIADEPLASAVELLAPAEAAPRERVMALKAMIRG